VWDTPAANRRDFFIYISTSFRASRLWRSPTDLVVAPKDQRRTDRFILFALAAASEAIAQAAWIPSDAHAMERTATIIASGIGGFPAIVEAVRTTDQRGVRRLSPFTIPSFLANLAAGHISIRYGFKGPVGTPVTACAASVQAIGDAVRLIRGREVDVAVCGGAEACIDVVSLGGFAAARALSTGFNETPARASRPFDRDRDGFVMGEGAGILVIEELERAIRRGAKPLAEIVGYGTTADAYHITSGPEDGDGAHRAMEGALRQASLKPGDIQHLNAHSTSTPVGDVSELEAIKAVLGRDIEQPGIYLVPVFEPQPRREEAFSDQSNLVLDLPLLPARGRRTGHWVDQVVAAHLHEAAIVAAILADKDRLHRGLHVVVDAAAAGALEQGERSVVGVEHCGFRRSHPCVPR
jgi:3-oxoacyl-[acyl-carrier-protein] synthase II